MKNAIAVCVVIGAWGFVWFAMWIGYTLIEHHMTPELSDTVNRAAQTKFYETAIKLQELQIKQIEDCKAVKAIQVQQYIPPTLVAGPAAYVPAEPPTVQSTTHGPASLAPTEPYVSPQATVDLHPDRDPVSGDPIPRKPQPRSRIIKRTNPDGTPLEPVQGETGNIGPVDESAGTHEGGNP